MKQRFLVGSRAFFAGLDGFQSKDRDYLELVDEPHGFDYRRERSQRGTCLFEYKREPARQMIERALQNGGAIQLGKFLVPEVASAIGLTIDDLQQLAPLVERLDNKHKYQAVIFNAYLANGSFTLTDEQRQEAYVAYTKARKKEGNKQAYNRV